MNQEERSAWLRLLLTPGVGSGTARRLLAAFGLPQDIWRHGPGTWEPVVGSRVAQALQVEPEGLADAQRRLEHWLAASPEHHLVSLGDPHYPDALLQTADPPLLLHVQGQIAILAHPHKLAIVGSRNPTPQGAANARLFARSLAESGLCIVSGLALGVDAAAHTGALDGDGPTIAVVGTGLDTVYPPRNEALAQRIVAQGAIVSEYLLGTPPLAPHFPQRNRIISGLSLGTLVVEAAVRSGSLITARLASEQGREVFAIPGSIHAPQSRGCHALIRQGAKLVESAQDVLEDLRLDAGAATLSAPLAAEAPDSLLSAMGFDPVGFDALQARTGLDTGTLQARLLELELDGQIGRLPGGLLQRVGNS